MGSAEFAKSLTVLHRIHSAVSTLLKKENKQYKLSDFPSAEFQSFPALDFALRCFTPTELANPARIVDADAFIDPDQVLKAVLGEKLVYTRDNMISFAACDEHGR